MRVRVRAKWGLAVADGARDRLSLVGTGNNAMVQHRPKVPAYPEDWSFYSMAGSNCKSCRAGQEQSLHSNAAVVPATNRHERPDTTSQRARSVLCV